MRGKKVKQCKSPYQRLILNDDGNADRHCAIIVQSLGKGFDPECRLPFV